jgi:hypothetical protein
MDETIPRMKVTPNKEMKLTSVERIGRSQLISSVRQTVPLNTHGRPAYPEGRG